MIAIDVERNYLGIIDGFKVWEVINTQTGKVVGTDQTPAEEAEIVESEPSQ